MASLSKRYLTSLLLAHLCIFVTVKGDLFPLPEFTGRDVTGSVFGADNDEIFPVAFGDLNADKLTDVVTVTRDKSSLVVLYSKQEAPYHRNYVHCNIRTEKNHTVEIVGVAPGDFNGDGLMDLAVTIEQPRTEDKELIILKGDANDVICDSGAEKVTAYMVQEPLAADLNGDMVVDLVGEIFEGEAKKVRRKLWLFKDDFTSPKEVLFTLKEGTRNKTDGFREMARPSSNAFVDIDGDYMPELIMVTEVSEDEKVENKVYSNARYLVEMYNIVLDESDKLTPVAFTKKREEIPIKADKGESIETVGQPLFIDLNQSGELVYILPFCNTKDCKESGKSGLIAVINGTTIELPLQGSDYDGKHWKWKHAVSKHGDQNVRSSFDGYFSRTIVLRVGDYNLDGYPDLIGVVEAGPESQSEKRAVVLENVACTPDAKVKCPFPRTFNYRFDVLQNYGNVTLATFYDIHDDSLIDVFLVRRSDNNTKPGHGRKYEVRAFENSPDYDSNFFKVMVLSGRQCAKCPQNGIPYGNVITGPIVRYKTTTQLGEHQQAVAAQNYRSSHLSLDLPYTIFGIGHSPNFVETLIVGMSPTRDENRTHVWPQIIPNSQIIVIHPVNKDTGSWKFKLFLTPSDAVGKTFAVLIGVIGVVFLIVCGLQYKERREDQMDRLQEAHRFMM